jgi:hypothetical protein
MSIFKRYIDAMNSADVNQMSELFAEDAVFDDSANASTGRPPLYLEGREEIEKMFTGFLKRKPVAKLIGIKENKMDYDVALGDLVLPCRATFIMTKDGKIQRLEARAR